MLQKKEKMMQQAMNTTIDVTSGGGTHTRWKYEDDYTLDELDVANIMITMKKTVKKAVKKAVKKVEDKKVVKNNSSNKNYEIAYALLKLSISDELDYYDPRKQFDIYKNAAESISKLDYAVTNGNELAMGPKKVSGIGKGIARLIDEYLKRGTMTITDYKKMNKEKENHCKETNIKECSNEEMEELAISDSDSDSDWVPTEVVDVSATALERGQRKAKARGGMVNDAWVIDGKAIYWSPQVSK